MKSHRSLQFILVVVPLLALFFLIAGQSGRAVPPVQESPRWEPQIAIVWPHDGNGRPASVADATRVNVSVWPGPANAVRCEHPGALALWLAENNQLAGVLNHVADDWLLRTVNGVTFPTLEFNDRVVKPGARTVFFATRQDAEGNHLFGSSNFWVHATDSRTYNPQPELPTAIAAWNGDPYQEPWGLAARIQVVWPHDGRGNPLPPDAATAVNVAVDLMLPSAMTRHSVPLDYEPPEGLILWVAGGNTRPVGMVNPMKTTVTVNGLTFPRWVFNDVPVTPGGQYHMMAEILGVKTAPTVWTHAADARTILPNPQVPPPCIP